MGPLCPCPNPKKPMKKPMKGFRQGRTDNSWGPRAIGDHGAPVSLPKLKKAYEKGIRGISWGPLLTPGPRAVPEFPNGQSAPGFRLSDYYVNL
ncbi:unnamed protein product [Staurois parvus]|uniref:Uncharacterized protein n=1 Tax=Staurois parvus TaxID=386267 RepID=A0ABN9EDC6_9NEOB|nr:unnamed protein product [Staurois parvus]